MGEPELEAKAQTPDLLECKASLLTTMPLYLLWFLQHPFKVSAITFILQMRKLRLREARSLSEDTRLISGKAGIQIQDHLTSKPKSSLLPCIVSPLT